MCRSVDKMENFDKGLEFYLDSEFTMEQLERHARTKGQNGDVFVRDENERRRRRELSQKMRETLLGYAKDYAKSDIERSKIKRIPLIRQLSSDTILQLPHEEQNGEYERRYQILVSGTLEEKKKLLFDTLHEVQKDYTPEKLMALTDEEVAADFENLYQL